MLKIGFFILRGKLSASQRPEPIEITPKNLRKQALLRRPLHSPENNAT